MSSPLRDILLKKVTMYEKQRKAQFYAELTDELKDAADRAKQNEISVEFVSDRVKFHWGCHPK